MLNWKDIPQYEGLYRANQNGEIYSVLSDKVLTPFSFKTSSAFAILEVFNTIDA